MQTPRSQPVTSPPVSDSWFSTQRISCIYERLQKLPVEAVYPGHYRMFGQSDYQQMIKDYMEAKRHPSCPSDQRTQP